jgi:hypothetical protein
MFRPHLAIFRQMGNLLKLLHCIFNVIKMDCFINMLQHSSSTHYNDMCLGTPHVMFYCDDSFLQRQSFVCYFYVACVDVGVVLLSSYVPR